MSKIIILFFIIIIFLGYLLGSKDGLKIKDNGNEEKRKDPVMGDYMKSIIDDIEENDKIQRSIEMFNLRERKSLKEYLKMKINSKNALKNLKEVHIKPKYNENFVAKYNANIERLVNIKRPLFGGAYCMNNVETICKMAFEVYFGQPFVKVRPGWLRNPLTGYPLEIDGFNENIVLKVKHGIKNGIKHGIKKGLGFEYQGPTHYEWPNYLQKKPKTREAFDKGVQRDKDKARICREKGIVILEIPYLIKNDQIPLFIFNSLDDLGYTPLPFNQVLINAQIG